MDKQMPKSPIFTYHKILGLLLGNYLFVFVLVVIVDVFFGEWDKTWLYFFKEMVS